MDRKRASPAVQVYADAIDRGLQVTGCGLQVASCRSGFALFGSPLQQVRQKFLHYSEADAPAHANSESDCRICSGTIAWRLPETRKTSGARKPEQQRRRRIAPAIVMASHYAARQSVSRARPEPFLPGTQVPVIFMQQTLEAEGDCFPDRILPRKIGKPFSVTGCALFPISGCVGPLVDACGQSCIGDPKGICQDFCELPIPLFLSTRLELKRLTLIRHIQISEQVIPQV